MMNHSNPKKNTSGLAGILAVALFVAAMVALIIFLKRNASQPFDSDGRLRVENDSVVARPDVGREVVGPIDSMAPQLPDTIMGTDERDVSDAGYEDGYWAGYDDAQLGQERASYDESSSFATSQERHRYTESYREGYAEGWQVGLQDHKDDKAPQCDETQNVNL